MEITGLDRETAYNAAGALTELIEPAADAVSIFEDGSNFRIDAYYAAHDVAASALALLGLAQRDVADRANISLLVQENWVALSQAALPPVTAGRFTICGRHDLSNVPRGPNTIIVEAGEAFGTAHHATTYGCLLAIDRLTRRRVYDNVLDLGTGSGVLALAVQRAVPNARIIGSDIDQRSIEVARENATVNGLGPLRGGPRFVVADGIGGGSGDGGISRRAPFDLIIANILAGPLIAMAPSITAILAERATVVLSGVLVTQAREVLARYASLGCDLVRHDRHHGWSTLTLRLRTAPRRPRRRPASSFNVFDPIDDE